MLNNSVICSSYCGYAFDPRGYCFATCWKLQNEIARLFIGYLEIGQVETTLLLYGSIVRRNDNTRCKVKKEGKNYPTLNGIMRSPRCAELPLQFPIVALKDRRLRRGIRIASGRRRRRRSRKA